MQYFLDPFSVFEDLIGMAFTIRIPPCKESLQELKEEFPDADLTAIDATLRMRICMHEFEEFMTSHLAKQDLSQARFSILMMLFKNPGRKAKPIELADYLGVTRGNMTGILDNLERDGWIERKDDPEDRRINYVCLTEKGLKHFKRMLPDHFERIRKWMQPLNKQERETFVACLEKLRANLQELKKNS